MSGHVGTQPSVDETLKDFWATRPNRPHSGRKIAGVAAGIAERYLIDPVVVRIALVVLALSNGAGLLLYLVAWLLLPSRNDEASPAESILGRGRSSSSTGLVVVLCLALLPTTGFVVSGGFPTISGLLLALGGLFLLHRHRGHLNPAAAVVAEPLAHQHVPPAAPTAPFPAHFGAVPATAPHAGSGAAAQSPPSWDPLGAAPFAWDLPEPSAPPVPPRAAAPRHRSRVGGVTFALAVLTAGAGVIAANHNPWFTGGTIAGLALGVVGLGLVVSAFRGGGRGLIGTAVPLSIVALVLTNAGFDRWERVGDVTARPTAVEQVDDAYETGAGNVTLDLSALPAQGEVETRVEVGVGGAEVIVPRTADVQVVCESGVGSVSCLGEERSGPGSELDVEDRGPDGEGGVEVELYVRSGVGDVEVTRG
ncbi:PspC domain-containing protein [Umezawaea beigongshangensis]|uniref:PspC domain-containing protein n=1 Tax=Umezawaea beigongshangensis TaxID=2780383 RepID=UPI0027DB4433|nr:PspC domain-containing protein [Umezawaea beigongshangensis]